MADSCAQYVSTDDLKAAKESILHIEHVATSKDANGNPALVVTDPIRGVGYTNATLDGLFSDIGFKPVNGSFEDGGTLVNRWDVLLYETNGSFYQWVGTIPVGGLVVSAGSSPFDSGSNLLPGWADQTDLTLRSDLRSPNGASFIGVQPQGTLAEMQFYVTPDQFGSYVDENTVFTTAIQAAIDYAASHPGIYVRGTEKTYGTGMLEVTVGCKRIEGLKLKCVVANTDSVLKSFVDTGHKDVVITNCDININSNSTKGIVMSGTERGVFSNNHVYGFAAGGERYGIRIGVLSNNSVNIGNKIKDNVIEMPSDPDKGLGSIAIVGVGLVGVSTSIYGGIDTNGGTPLYPSVITVRDTEVSGNLITGGTHGVAGGGIFRAEFIKNNINGCSHRNINLSGNTQRVLVSSNFLLEGGSSGVNVAWGSRWVNITGNYIQSSSASTQSTDDAAIQMYKGVDQCVISGNVVIGDWKYSLYLGSMVTNITVSGNSFNAGSLANVAVESDWVNTSTYPLAIYSRNYDPTTVPVAGDSGNINIGGNTYTGSGCAIYLVAVNGKALYNVNIHDEVVGSAVSRNHVTYFYDSETIMTDTVLSNIAARGATAAQHYLSRGRGAFSFIKKVTALDDGSEVSVPSGTPSAVYGPNLYLASGTVTNFTGAQAGDTINVRMADGVILVHNSSIMRLRGSVNATASGGLAIITLQRRAGVWFETSRNF